MTEAAFGDGGPWAQSWKSAAGAREGYATAMALVMSLAISLVAVAVVTRSAAELKSASSDVERQKAELALDGLLIAAANEVAQARGSGPYLWQEGSVEILAEAEWKKLGADGKSALPEALLSAMKVENPDAVKSAFASLVTDPKASSFLLADLDAAPKWRACAPSLLSRYGAAASLQRTALSLLSPTSPTGAGAEGRVGEVWRLRATRQDGWRDERYIRFTGDPTRPAAIIDRRFTRHTVKEASCQDLIASAG